MAKSKDRALKLAQSETVGRHVSDVDLDASLPTSSAPSLGADTETAQRRVHDALHVHNITEPVEIDVGSAWSDS